MNVDSNADAGHRYGRVNVMAGVDHRRGHAKTMTAVDYGHDRRPGVMLAAFHRRAGRAHD